MTSSALPGSAMVNPKKRPEVLDFGVVQKRRNDLVAIVAGRYADDHSGENQAVGFLTNGRPADAITSDFGRASEADVYAMDDEIARAGVDFSISSMALITAKSDPVPSLSRTLRS